MGSVNGHPRLTFHAMLLWIAACILIMPLPAASQEWGADNGPYAVGAGIKPPVVLFQPLPSYTDEARTARVEGIVLLQAIIRKDGTVDSFKVIRGLGYGLDESAINTIATRWQFQPGTRNGEPVDVQANIEVSFRLYNRPEDAEKLKAYPLRIAIVEAKWDQSQSGTTSGFGYGNLLATSGPRGFTYTTACGPVFRQGANIPAKWIEPGSRLEILANPEPGTGAVKPCEFRIEMQSTLFTLIDGQVVAVDPPNPIQK